MVLKLHPYYRIQQPAVISCAAIGQSLAISLQHLSLETKSVVISKDLTVSHVQLDADCHVGLNLSLLYKVDHNLHVVLGRDCHKRTPSTFIHCKYMRSFNKRNPFSSTFYHTQISIPTWHALHLREQATRGPLAGHTTQTVKPTAASTLLPGDAMSVYIASLLITPAVDKLCDWESILVQRIRLTARQGGSAAGFDGSVCLWDVSLTVNIVP